MEVKKLAYKIVPLAWGYIAIAAVVAYLITGDFDWVYYIILGGVTSLFGFSLLVRHAKNMKPDAGAFAMFGNYVLRYIIYAFILAFAVFNDGVSMLIPVLIGLMAIKAGIIVHVVLGFMNKRGKEESHDETDH